MKVLGIIAEYNPFHNGHYYQVQKAKEETGADYVIVIMSGNFTQRGEAAIVDKYARTKMALACKIDLVIELPACFATGSAEFFAISAVSHLTQMGMVDILCFGSECGDLDLLTSVANILSDEPTLYQTYLKYYLKQGHSFPAARSKAVSDYFSSTRKDVAEAVKEVLSKPNNILGIEYLKALRKLNSPILPLTIRRISSGYHDTSLSADICSATALRKHIHAEDDPAMLSRHIPAAAFESFYNAADAWLSNHDFSLQLSYKLLTENNFSQYMDVNSDLASRISNMQDSFVSFDEFAAAIKCKSYTRTRLNRCLLHILLNITKELNNDFSKHHYCAYLRILGFRKSSTPLLKNIKSNCELPMLLKMADAKQLLSRQQFALLESDIYAANVYRHASQIKFRKVYPNEFTQGIILY